MHHAHVGIIITTRVGKIRKREEEETTFYPYNRKYVHPTPGPVWLRADENYTT